MSDSKFDVSSSANVWGINSSQNIFRFDGNQFNQVAGKLTQISVGADGTVWGINSSVELV
jgi:tectonin-like protein